MLYELESSPYARKPSVPTSKLKVSKNLTENQSSDTLSNNVRLTKTPSNGNGFRNDKIYGPEFPPDITEKSMNGNSSNLNGSSILDSPPTSSESDSDIDNDILLHYKSTSHDTEKESSVSLVSSDPKKSLLVQANSSVSSPNVSTSLSSLSSPEYSPKQEANVSSMNSQIMKPLVPYESDDTSSSDDSNHYQSNNIESRVSTKAAVGEYFIQFYNMCINLIYLYVSWYNIPSFL